MQSISIRQLSGSRVMQAAADREVLGVTNGRVLCAVLVPLQQRLVDQLVVRNLSEIVHGVLLGEKDLAENDAAPDLEAVQDVPPVARPARTLPGLTPVGIRQLSAHRIEQAARDKTPLGITNHGVMCAILIPVSQRWVEQTIHANLSRIVKGVLLGESHVAAGRVFDAEDALTDESVLVDPVLADLAPARSLVTW